MFEAFVYVVESPAPRDVYEGRTEGRALCEALKLADIKHSYTMALDQETFADALSTADGSRLVIESNRHRATTHFLPPIIHFSGHGDSEGIALCNNALITWQELRDLLLPINEAIPPGLMIAFSSCSGASGSRMSMYMGDQHKPFFGCLGSYQNVRWDDALVGFVTFYHSVFKHGDVARAVEAMKIASGDASFVFEAGAESKQRYETYCLNLAGREGGLNAGVQAAYQNNPPLFPGQHP